MMGKLKILLEKLKKLVWPFWGDDKTGSIAYFEDTGEEMGIVKRVIRDTNGKVAGYEIEDVKTGKTISMSKSSFDITERGLVFVPLWYSEAREFIEEMELKAKMPELSDIISESELSKREIGEIARSHPELGNYIKNAIVVKDSINKRLRDLEERRAEVRKKLMMLSEKRLLDEIGRREFAQSVIGARRDAKILDMNVRRCRELLIRLENIPFLPKETIPLRKEKPEEILPLKELMDNIPINMAVIDNDGKILDVNEHFRASMKYSDDEVKGRMINEFMENGGLDFNNYGQNDVEFTFVDGDGNKKKMFGRYVGVMEGTEYVNVLAFQEKIEDGEEFRKIFAKQISHEFFNPLCIAQGYLYLLEEGKYGELTEKQKKQVESISHSLKRIENLVKETIKVRP
ncbi:MAG: PAS domain S-box protein [Thermoplasmata archaeon]|nr:MAG: PAS domain S-box protein [Thermoplasmata archaeon]HDH81703.1 PAS domain S-box protein [Thermoplasmatales archaeon]